MKLFSSLQKTELPVYPPAGNGSYTNRTVMSSSLPLCHFTAFEKFKDSVEISRT